MLQMCYSFELLGPQFTPEHIRNTVEGFFKVATDGWPCWAFSNHDVERHVTRWSEHPHEAEVAKLCISLLASLRGSLCIYQGEELGLTETALTYEQLQDPYGIRFWPDFKGRDGCRTPYLWDSSAPNAGFTDGKPWLPLPSGQMALAQQEEDQSSVLHHYRAVLNARGASPCLLTGALEFIESSGTILSFERSTEGEERWCVFNFSDQDTVLDIFDGYADAVFVQAFTRHAKVYCGKLTLGAFGTVMLAR